VRSGVVRCGPMRLIVRLCGSVYLYRGSGGSAPGGGPSGGLCPPGAAAEEPNSTVVTDSFLKFI